MRTPAIQTTLDRELAAQASRLPEIKLNFNPREKLTTGQWMALDMIRHDYRRAFCAARHQHSKAVTIDTQDVFNATT